MLKVKSFLEQPDADHEAIIPAVQILQSIFSHYPAIFKSHFQDVIDLLVGWRLDLSLSDRITQQIAGKVVYYQLLITERYFHCIPSFMG